MTYIQHAGISQRIQISQFRFWGDNSHTFRYILCNFGEDGPVNQKISQGVSVPFGTRRQKLTYHTNYLSKYWTKLRQLFSFGRIVSSVLSRVVRQ